MNPNSIEMLLSLALEHGWSKSTMLAHACDYIDGIVGGNEGFRLYLSDVLVEEKDDGHVGGW
jgi:hypothetical protein